MTTKSEFILNEALSMSPAGRARIAHCLIYSLEEPITESVDAQWIQLSQKRLEELESGTVQPVSWEEIKKKVRE
ncbi:MAG: addiction module protein [Desulfosalsimonadaceae bacterium]